ncbi:MAG TPA: tetratricopeptide repeat protein [Nitrospirota bacterium]|nr:tetratricopeptide repeat protein [Nitrospirota bacterium]
MYEHALLIDPQNADVRTDMGTTYRSIGKSGRSRNIVRW